MERRHLGIPILDVSRQVHERPLTQTVVVTSQQSVPPGFLRVPVKSPAIFAKVQVLSSRLGHPIFVEQTDLEPGRRVAYWVHPAIVPDLAEWLSHRVFPLYDLIDEEQPAPRGYSKPKTSYIEYRPGP